MGLGRRDLTVATLAVLVVGVPVTTYAGWGVPLIGDSHRWAAVVILALALLAGALEAPGSEPPANVLAGLVIVAFLLGVIALASGSLAALVLLVVAILALVAVDTARHTRQARSRGTQAAA